MESAHYRRCGVPAGPHGGTVPAGAAEAGARPEAVRFGPFSYRFERGELREGETLSGFVEASVRGAVEYRRVQDAFQARGEAAWQAYQRDGVSRSANDVLAELQARLDRRRKQLRPHSTP